MRLNVRQELAVACQGWPGPQTLLDQHESDQTLSMAFEALKAFADVIL